MGIADLRGAGRGYIATPYTLHPSGLEYAYKLACGLLANLSAAGLHVYSPIAHWHTAALIDTKFTFGKFSPDDWFNLNKPEMDICAWMLVPYDREENWRQSVGIHKERLYFHQSIKPVYFYEAASDRVSLLSDVVREGEAA